MSENSRPQQTDSAEYRKLRRKRQQHRRAVLKRRLALLCVCLAAVIVLIVVLVLKANDVFYKKADVSTLTVKSDGSIVLEEVVSVKDIDTDEKELKASLKKSIDDFNSGKTVAGADAAAGGGAGTAASAAVTQKDAEVRNGSGAVKLQKVSVKDGAAYVRTTYPDAATYAAYSGYTCYIGSVTGAKAVGYDFSSPLCPVVGKERGEAVAADTLTDTDGLQTVIVNEDINIRVPGEISYVTANVASLKDSDETAVSGTGTYGTSVAPDTYILYTTK